MLHSVSEILGKTEQAQSYQSKLHDPRWESRRRRFIAGQGAWCRSCKRRDVTLHVHHRVYRRGVEPWDHCDDDLVVLCAGCHSEWHDILQEFRGHVIGRIPLSAGRVIIRALSLLLKFNRPESVGFALAQLACEQQSVTNLSVRYQADETKGSHA